jgi:hypothetical protein
MTMRRKCSWKGATICVVGVTLMALAGARARAATVQGALFCPAQSRPAYNAAVSVFRADIGQSNLAAVGQNGMFYLYNIPPGNYVLQVWSRTNPSQQPLLYQISVFEPLTSLPLLQLPC